MRNLPHICRQEQLQPGFHIAETHSADPAVRWYFVSKWDETFAAEELREERTRDLIKIQNKNSLLVKSRVVMPFFFLSSLIRGQTESTWYVGQ
jgi:hypothetical protein